jgi:hypothetical protein
LLFAYNTRNETEDEKLVYSSADSGKTLEIILIIQAKEDDIQVFPAPKTY